MPRDRDFKKLVRGRMSKTGEAYTSARAKLVGAPAPRTPYPFERFTHPAKLVLSLAQEEADGVGAGYIGSEHVLVGLIRARQGLAAQALRRLGIRLQPVQAAARRRRPAPGEEAAGRALPASDVRSVIQKAFGEAGGGLVDTAHLLLGLAAQPDSTGGRLLARQAALDGVRGAIAAARAEAGEESTSPPARTVPRPSRTIGSALGMPTTEGVFLVLRAAQELAFKEGADTLRSDHLLSAMVRPDGTLPALRALLAATGSDLGVLRRKLLAPRRVRALESRLGEVRHLKTDAVAGQDFEQAARLRAEENRLREELARHLDGWQAGWGAAGR